MDWVFDAETFPNIFTLAIGSVDKREAYVFEISDRRDDSKSMRKFLGRLHRNNDRMIGFNNIGFDWPVLNFFLRNRGCSSWEIYDFAMEVLKTSDTDKFKYVIPNHKALIYQIDLYRIHHFDNKARATSLKMLEFNMRSPNIEDLPFAPGTKLTHAEKDTLVTYNKHDVKETFAFYRETLDAIRFREELSKKYKRDFINHNDTKIGKDYFVMELEKAMPGSCYRQLPGGGRKINQTKREYIDLDDVIFPYVRFERPEFQEVLNWIRRQRITETKGVFTNIPEHELGELAQYANLLTKKKKFKGEPTQEELDEFYREHPKGWVEEKLLKSGKTSYYAMWRVGSLNTVVDGFQYDFGTGGIHGAVTNTILETDDDYVVETWDVSSYYPNLAIVNRVYPEHLGEKFCDIYRDVYLERKKYPKGTPENAVMKLALNGTYGASNDKFSPFFDPKFTMAITINGQLSLCMLAEKLIEIDGLRIVMVNTDGLEFVVPRESQEKAHQVCHEWEELTGLELEGGVYKKLCIRDVNNYLGILEE
ncbi:MAG: hypothetical protein CMF22_10480 [Idiomarinaceae bacterium]|nr:hypothetical protein [Idiomarinaceae bacterium]MBG23866.1 hypothetical protein [Idiomarinaceae bacterium]